MVGTGSLRVVGATTQLHLAVASWKVMEKLGMRREEHSVKEAWHGELGWVDGYTYAIVADEWRSEATGV